MSSDKPSTIVTPAVILSVVALVAAIAGPAINYGASDGGKSAEIGALRERIATAENQISEMRKDVKDLTRELKTQVGAIEVSVAEMKGTVKQFVASERGTH